MSDNDHSEEAMTAHTAGDGVGHLAEAGRVLFHVIRSLETHRGEGVDLYTFTPEVLDAVLVDLSAAMDSLTLGRLAAVRGKPCDGEHPAPRCMSPECWRGPLERLGDLTMDDLEGTLRRIISESCQKAIDRADRRTGRVGVCPDHGEHPGRFCNAVVSDGQICGRSEEVPDE